MGPLDRPTTENLRLSAGKVLQLDSEDDVRNIIGSLQKVRADVVIFDPFRRFHSRLPHD